MDENLEIEIEKEKGEKLADANISSNSIEQPRFDDDYLRAQLGISDVKLLDEEEFDFDLPFSPRDSKSLSDNTEVHTADNAAPVNDDDEIFMGPVGYTEKCVSAVVEASVRSASLLQRRETLSAAEMAELCKEAFTVASRIQLSALTEATDESSDDSVFNVCETVTSDKVDNPVVLSSEELLAIKTMAGCDEEKDLLSKDAAKEKEVVCHTETTNASKRSPDLRNVQAKAISQPKSAMEKPTQLTTALKMKRKLDCVTDVVTNESVEKTDQLSTVLPEAKRCRTEPTKDEPQVESEVKKQVSAISKTKSLLPQAKSAQRSRLLPPGSLKAGLKSGSAAAGPSATTGIPSLSTKQAPSLLPVSSGLNAKPTESKLSCLQAPKTFGFRKIYNGASTECTNDIKIFCGKGKRKELISEQRFINIRLSVIIYN